MSTGTLLLPIAGRSARFPGIRPKWMLTAPNGQLMLELALETVPHWRNHRVIIGALKEHLCDLGGEIAIRRALGNLPEIVSFDSVTSGPAETVIEMICRNKVTGPIFIKDCDSWFSCSENLFDNLVCTIDLHDYPKITSVARKSFVQTNGSEIITGIFEKIVCSNHISVGGYGVRSADLFLEAYSSIGCEQNSGEPFVSHVLLELIRRGEVFKSSAVKDYNDVGTLEAWHSFRNNHGLYLCDIDGVVFRNAGEYFPPFWSEPDVPLVENIYKIRGLIDSGAQFIFLTARPEKYREKTEQSLNEAGLKWASIIFGLNHSRRFLLNDFAPTNPFPSAVAINLPRDQDMLNKFL
ncbi:hypothetical protein SAMN04488144_113171 [Methylobacterium sp. 190mf]|uniref:hypothetical protein n=1 Tax=Methylobacterium sp. 190mf TaxID=1761798 RepID=UPI00089EA53B|nr:hypothetical protein [Methylobacterium sp. 190mf]SEG31761.1 hypothetical protein SAMN04488144_113171 [Methylobacterium sp. 190mf]